MKRIFLILVVAILIYVLGRQVVLLFVPDETRITWLLQEVVDRFNERDNSGCRAHLASDYQHKSPRLDNGRLRALLARLFLKGVHPETHAFRYRADLQTLEEGAVSVGGGNPKTANGRAIVHLSEEQKGKTIVLWEVRLEAELEKAGSGWEIKRTRHETIDGRMPVR